MKAQARRNAIMEVLQKKKEPVSASTLAKQFHVSRQIIVGDVALLRAGGAGYPPPRPKDICWPGTGAELCGRLSVCTTENRWERNCISVWTMAAVCWT